MAASIVLACACGDSQHDASHAQDAASGDAATADAARAVDDAANGVDAAQTDGQLPLPEAVPGFEAIAIEDAGRCANARGGLVVRTRQRVLAATGCGLYAIDTSTKQVTRLNASGDALASDGDGETVAVLAGKLGLSIDAGEHFEWTDWSLGRCQGSPKLTAGDHFAVVTCVGGIGRWRGAGSTFDAIEPSTTSTIAGTSAARGANLVIAGSNGWFLSTDGGSSFAALDATGLPEQAPAFGMQIATTKLFVPVGDPLTSETALYASALGGGGFTRVDTLPTLQASATLGYGGGNLLVHVADQFFASSDEGASFTKLNVTGFPNQGVVASYVSGDLYVLSNGTLYVASPR